MGNNKSVQVQVILFLINHTKNELEEGIGVILELILQVISWND